ncbi:MAG: cupin domain-containing protein [Pseudolabrys sp.]|nr:cupin domain-containing protein [Pseudolabrys sp.]
MSDTDMRFSASHLKDARFADGGLRSFFVYRDLGIKEATGGRVMAHVIRAKSAQEGGSDWHRHILDFQMFYVIKGWIRFRYEGIGEVLAEAGSCVHQPPGIRHVEIGHSGDLELIEIALPADFATTTVALPESVGEARTDRAATAAPVGGR